MNTQPIRIKELVLAAINRIEQAHLGWSTRICQPTLVQLPSATHAMVSHLVAEIRGGRSFRLCVFTQTNPVDLTLALMANWARIPFRRLVQGDVGEEDFRLLTTACGRIAASNLELIHAPSAAHLQTSLATVPTELLFLTDVPVSDHQAEVFRELAAVRHLSLILYTSDMVLPAHRW